MSTQSFLGTGKGAYKLWDKTLDLAYLYAIHLSQILYTSLFILCKTSKVLKNLKISY
jgi:hypothetical protein